jgi:hypothetical protein
VYHAGLLFYTHSSTSFPSFLTSRASKGKRCPACVDKRAATWPLSSISSRSLIAALPPLPPLPSLHPALPSNKDSKVQLVQQEELPCLFSRGPRRPRQGHRGGTARPFPGRRPPNDAAISKRQQKYWGYHGVSAIPFVALVGVAAPFGGLLPANGRAAPPDDVDGDHDGGGMGYLVVYRHSSPPFLRSQRHG